MIISARAAASWWKAANDRPARLGRPQKVELVLGPTFSLLGTTREEEIYGTNHSSRPSQRHLRGHADVRGGVS
jgi:hypothetical protein